MTRDQKRDLGRISGAGSLLTLSLLLHAPARAQSFDCKKATTTVEHAICDNKVLADLDVSLATELKKALVVAPTRRGWLLADERRWLARRDSACRDGPEPRFLHGCLDETYRARIQYLQSLGTASGSSSTTTNCQKIADRYRAAQSAAPGSGIVPKPVLRTFEDVAVELPKWASSQHPPIVIPPDLVGLLADDNVPQLWKLPNENFYFLTAIVPGRAECHDSVSFQVENGHARKIDLPPEIDDDSCEATRYLGLFDGVPAFFQESASDDSTAPNLSKTITVMTWTGGKFSAPCKTTLLFAPRFSLGDDPTCNGSECVGLGSAALKLARAMYEDPDETQRKQMAALSPSQSSEYIKTLSLVGKSQMSEAIEWDFHVPVVHQEHVYVASIHRNHSYGGSRLLALNVILDSLVNGTLVSQGEFVVNIEQDRLLDALVN